MQIKKLSIMMLVGLMSAAFINGCGSSSKESGTVSSNAPKVAESACAQCHGSAVSSVTGLPLYSGYINSAHFDNNVGCQDCHGGGSQHNGVGPMPYANSDQAGRCVTCHSASERIADANGVQIMTKKHFGIDASGNTSSLLDPSDPTSVAPYATYVTESSKNNCRFCHDPHAAVTPQHSQWAETGHASLDRPVFRQFDFAAGAPPKGACGLKCHTTTGYKTFIANQSATLSPFKTSATDTTMEVIRCDACHQNYSWKRNKVSGGAIAIPFTTTNGLTSLPASGDSNLCMGCHIGFASGKVIANATSVDGVKFEAFSPHYKTSAAILYGVNGYEFQAHSAYAAPPYFEHDLPGTVAGPAAFGTKNGACVVCHMWVDGTNKNSHLMEPATYTNLAATANGRNKIDADIGTLTATAVCAACHTGAYPLTAASLNTAKLQFKAEIDALQAAIAARGISFDPIDGPHYFKDATADLHLSTGSKYAIKWTSVAPDANGKNMAGAAYNLLTLIKDSGAYVHNSRYTHTLLYDSLDYVVNGTLTGALGSQGANLTIGSTTIVNPFNGSSRP